MGKAILIYGVVLTSLASSAQIADQKPPRIEKEYSFLWGIFKSKDYAKSKAIAFEEGKPECTTSYCESTVDSSKQERKSILWGAIQWTEPKSIASKNK